MEELLRARLLQNAALAALIGTRMHWLLRPQRGALPAIGLQIFGSARNYTLEGPQDFLGIGVQADVWAGSYAEMKAVSRAFVAAMHELTTPPLQAFVDIGHESAEAQDGPDAKGSTTFYRARHDCRIWFTPA